MLGLNGSMEPSLRTWVRNFARLATVCGVVMLLTLNLGGCPGQPEACTDASTCGDDEACTLDECTAGVCTNSVIEGCCNTDADCDDEDLCTTDACANNTCSNTAVDCNDDDACTDDSCDAATGDCVNTDVACAEGEVCVEGDCVLTCTAAADCDDTDACTDDSCVDGVCAYADVNCDDGDACTTDACDATTGCASTAIECPAGQVCENGDCVEVATCESDADCDDGVFCNGEETCGADNVCAEGTDPCAADQTCDEANDLCVSPAGNTFDLTFSSDTFTGGSGDDTFDGALDVIGGTIFQTVNSGDSLTGGGGTDSIRGQLRGGGTTTPALLNSIEVVNAEITDANASTLNLLAATGVTTVNNSNSGAALTVSNIATKLTNVGFTNGSSDLTVSVLNSGTTTPLSGTTDALTLTLSGINDTGASPVVTIQPSAAGSGYETLNIVTQGPISNSVQQITDGNGNSLATINISGSQGLTIEAALDATVTRVDANVTGSVLTGPLSVLLPASNTTVIGGSGNDTFNFGGNFNTSDSVNGGAGGTDVLASTSANLAGTTSALASTVVTAIDTVSVTDALAGNLNVNHYGATGAKLAGIDGTARTITVPNSGSVELTADAGAANHVIAVSSDGSTDTLSLILNDADLGANIVLTTWETVGLESKGSADGGANVITGTTALATSFAGSRINVTGSANLTFTGAITANVVDGNLLTGVLTVTAGTSGSANIIGGSAADVITGGNSADQLEGRVGADTLQGEVAGTTAAVDTLIGGDGVDNFVSAGVAGSSANADVINDFVTGASGDKFVIDLSLAETAGAIDATGGEVVDFTELQDGSSVADTDTIVITECTGACTPAANANVIVVVGVTLATTDALETALETGGSVALTISAAGGDVTSSFPVVYSNGTDAFVAVCFAETETTDNTAFESGDLTCVNVFRTPTNPAITAGEFNIANFDYIP